MPNIERELAVMSTYSWTGNLVLLAVNNSTDENLIGIRVSARHEKYLQI